MPQYGVETIGDGDTVHRLSEEARGARRFGAAASPLFRESRDEDYWYVVSARAQLGLQLQARHAWHMDIENQA